MPHFRVAALREAGGWDAWNVTEDADLGLRLARFGHRVETLDCATEETAPRNYADWSRQRRRWMKGWLQTFLVLLGAPARTWRDFGPSRLLVAVPLLVSMVLGPLLTPIYLLAFMAMPLHPVSRMALAFASGVPVAGALFAMFAAYGGARRLGWRPGVDLLLLPLYQILICLAALGALWDFWRRPHHWHKTPHPPRR